MTVLPTEVLTSFWEMNDHPVTRFALYLYNQGMWSEQQEKEWKNESKKQVLQAFSRAERKLKPNWKDLQRQMDEMESHVKMYKDRYPLENFEH